MPQREAYAKADSEWREVLDDPPAATQIGLDCHSQREQNRLQYRLLQANPFIRTNSAGSEGQDGFSRPISGYPRSFWIKTPRAFSRPHKRASLIEARAAKFLIRYNSRDYDRGSSGTLEKRATKLVAASRLQLSSLHTMAATTRHHFFLCGHRTRRQNAPGAHQ